MIVDTSTVSGQVVMLSDTLRVDSYGEAIRQKVRPGDVVVDLGSGSGVMARFAALAGASRVVAIEQNPELCELNEHTNYMLGLDEVVEVVNGLAEEVRLPDRIDVVISEVIGSLADDEGMSQILTAFCDAHRERLAADVRFVPEDVVLFGQLVESDEGREPASRAEKEAALAFRRAAQGELLILTGLGGLKTVGEPFRLLSVTGEGAREGGRGEDVVDFTAAGIQGLPRAMACWFEATLADGVSLDSRGDSRVSTSWGWALVPLSSEAAPQGRLEDLKLSFRLRRRRGRKLQVEATLS